MVFSSAVFIWIFLPIVFLLNLILPKKCSNIFLLFASLFFYAWGEPVNVVLMVFTIILNWLVGLGITKYEARRKLILILGVILDVSLLGYFKYANFLVNTINAVLGGEVITPPGIALPIGISFFTFQAISYIVDVYRGDTEPSENLINVALYIAYFPQLIAGPIVKYKEINKQIIDRSITREGVALGLRRFMYGLGKKVILSNILGKSVDLIFGLSLDVIGFKLAWLGAILFPIQIYYDFSGYSDMAIGLGKMFGFDIPENFMYPYVSKSITEYWRRWHISLGSWFREYVYFPLGGSKKGNIRTAINLTIMFTLTGFWHGASFSFIAFGLYMAFFMVIERFWVLKKLDSHPVLSRIYFFAAFLFSIPFFRANDLVRALKWMGKMCQVWKIAQPEMAVGNFMNTTTVVVLVMSIIGAGIVQFATPVKIRDKWKGSVAEWLYLLVVMILSMALIASDTYNPFIYFNF